jgi:hypothetical protein
MEIGQFEIVEGKSVTVGGMELQSHLVHRY